MRTNNLNETDMGYVEQCNGKINILGFCERCGQKSQQTTSSVFCSRLIEVIPASSNTTSKEESQPIKQKVYLVMTQQLIIVGCFSTEDKARKYAGNYNAIVQELEVF